MTYHNTFPRKMFSSNTFAQKFHENSMLVENQLPHASASAWKIIIHKPKAHSTWTGNKVEVNKIFSVNGKNVCREWPTTLTTMHRDVFVMFIACDFLLWIQTICEKARNNILCPSVLLDFAWHCVLSLGQDTRLLRRDLNRMSHADLRRAVRKR